MTSGARFTPTVSVTAGGLSFVQCPSLGRRPSAWSTTADVRLIVRRDFALEGDRSAGFARDVMVYRFIGRFAVRRPGADEGHSQAHHRRRRARRWRPEAGQVMPKVEGDSPPRLDGPRPQLTARVYGSGHVTVVLPPARPGVTVPGPGDQAQPRGQKAKPCLGKTRGPPIKEGPSSNPRLALTVAPAPVRLGGRGKDRGPASGLGPPSRHGPLRHGPPARVPPRLGYTTAGVSQPPFECPPSTRAPFECLPLPPAERGPPSRCPPRGRRPPIEQAPRLSWSPPVTPSAQVARPSSTPPPPRWATSPRPLRWPRPHPLEAPPSRHVGPRRRARPPSRQSPRRGRGGLERGGTKRTSRRRELVKAFETLPAFAHAGTVARKFTTSRRREVLSWSHHAEGRCPLSLL